MTAQRAVVWVSGHLVPADLPAVSATDAGLRSGLGVFTSLRVVDGRPHRLMAHLARLVTDAAALGIELGADATARLHDAMMEVVDANRQVFGDQQVLRPTITSGPVDVLAPWPGVTGPPTIVIAAHRAMRDPSAPRTAVYATARRVLPTVKSTSELAATLARREAVATGADEALLCDGEEILEGAASSLLTVVDGVLVTPPEDGRILPGVTRSAVIAAAHAAGVPVREESVRRHDLPRADETALCSSVRGVVALRAVEGAPLPGLGPILTALRDTEAAVAD